MRFLIAVALALLFGAPAYATPPGVINQYNAVCDANFPTRCATVNSDGTLATGGPGGASGSGALGAAKATAADPVYVEGSVNPLSQNLGGYQRVFVPTTQLLIVGTPGAPSSQVISAQGVANMTPLFTSLTGAAPIASITGNASGTTGAVVGTLAAVSAKTTYICGFAISAIGGTAALGPITVAGLVGTSQVYQLASSATGVTLPVTYTPCIPASAPNTAITITTTANGTATAVNVNSWGYQQ
jgi:hypothetical protein